VFTIASAGPVSIYNLTFANSAGTSAGGAIDNLSSGLLTVTACTFTGNGSAFISGGAIYNDGPLTVTACTFIGNISAAGGAIYNDHSGNLTAKNCTFNGNYAAPSCGFCIAPGGAIFNDGTLTLIACTISGNSASLEGGVCLQEPASIGNCVIAGNSAVLRVPDIGGSNFTSLGFNLFGILNGPQGQIPENPSQPGYPIGYDVFGVPALPLNPGLDSLASNGGQTETMAPHISEFCRLGRGCLVFYAPATDSGNCSDFGVTTDQRNLPRQVNLLHGPLRPGGDYSDIGAYESQTIPNNFAPVSCPLCPLHIYYRFQFLSIDGASNTVQSRDDLVSGIWSNLPGSFVGNGGIMEADITNSSTVAQQFYRVAATLPEVYVPPLAAIDSTLDPAYSNAWTSGSDGVQGFGPWVLTATSTNLSTDGFFIGSPTNNVDGTNDINVVGSSWGMYANSNALAVAYRAISNSVPVGGLLGIDMDNGYINASGTVGFVLRNGNVTSSPTNYTTGGRLQFLYIGGDASNSYKVVDSTGQQNIGVPLTFTGLHLVLALTTTNTYMLLTIDNASGTTNSTFSGTLAGSGTVDSIALFNNNAGAGSGNNVYFNSLQTVGL
jgi:hypothetical protein